VGEIRAYLSHLAGKNVALSTLRLPPAVLHMNFPEIDNLERARRPRWVPVVTLALDVMRC